MILDLKRNEDSDAARMTQCYHLAGTARFRRIDHEGLILNQSTSEIVVINSTASRIIEELHVGHTTLEISDILEEIYIVDRNELEQDVLKYLERLFELGVLLRCDE